MTTPKRVILWVAVSSERQAADDKESVGDQLRRQQERASKNGWLVIDQIIINGFSRDYLTYQEFSDAAANEGFIDPQRMWKHWADRDFEILSCRDVDRLGREQSIVAEFISRTVKAGAIILPLDSSSVDMQNYRFASAMQGMEASTHIDRLKRGRDLGMRARAGRGEQVGNRVPTWYAVGSDGKLYPDRERFQRFFDDVAELYLAGTSYEQLPRELAARGHTRADGRPYEKGAIRKLFLKARTYGHGEFNRVGLKRGRGEMEAAMWVTGRTEPPPEVHFVRDVIEPIWTGQQREDMIDEFERRYNGIQGAARPHDTYALSSLCVCEVCGHHLAIQIKHKPYKEHRYLVCHYGRLREHACTNNRHIRFDVVQDYIKLLIDRARDSDATFPTETPPARSRVPAIEREIAKLTVRIDNLIDLIADAPLTARAEYQAKIDAATANREILRAERARAAVREREAEYTTRQRANALATLATVDLWALPGTQANQLLRKFLGSYRLTVNDAAVTGLRDCGGR